jgi:addiction module RelE/StbE family toxin
MSSRFEVVWAEAAARDLEELVDYIARDSEGDAEKIFNRLRARAESLSLSPSRGRFVPELRAYGIRTWRELLIRPYRIVYRISGETVVVLAVLDGRRDLEDLLLERLVRI